jgi:hypothetical protein
MPQTGQIEPHPVLSITDRPKLRFFAPSKRTPGDWLDKAREQGAMDDAGDIEPKRHDFGDPDRPRRPSEESWGMDALTWLFAIGFFGACFSGAGFMLCIGWIGAKWLIAWLFNVPMDLG